MTRWGRPLEESKDFMLPPEGKPGCGRVQEDVTPTGTKVEKENAGVQAGQRLRPTRGARWAGGSRVEFARLLSTRDVPQQGSVYYALTTRKHSSALQWVPDQRPALPSALSHCAWVQTLCRNATPGPHTDLHTAFTAASLIMPQTWKRPEGPSAGDR